MSARKTSRDALTVRAPVMLHQLVRKYRVDQEARTTVGERVIALELARQLPDEATDDEARAREYN